MPIAIWGLLQSKPKYLSWDGTKILANPRDLLQYWGGQGKTQDEARTLA